MYTAKETERLIEIYLKADDKSEAIERLIKEMGRSKRSIIGKLSKEGVYEKQEYRSKTGELPITKKEIVAGIAEALELNIEKLSGLEKAPKLALKELRAALEE